ncbi:MAG TPA: hypothetical protein VHM65_01470, partial [Candidatus Lustribacter sp.]|nr:hypothetical protein [Candidatus Lustribacter sp.]
MSTTTTHPRSALSDLRALKGASLARAAQLVGMTAERVEAIEAGDGTGQEQAALYLALVDLPNHPADEDDYTPGRWESARWHAGLHLANLGERLRLAGARLCGDQPRTVDQLMRGSYD